MTRKRKVVANTKFDFSRLIAPVLFVFILAVYLLTLCPTIGFRDSGDMVTASYVLGVSHPSGFPLYMLTGKLFSFLPLFGIAFRYSLMSAFFAALTGVFVFWSVRKLTGSAMLGVIAALMLCFSVTFWIYANFGEKYTLYAFFTALLLWLTINIKGKTLPVLAFFAGLAFTHHLAILCVVLPIAVYLLISFKTKVLLRKLPLLLFLFLLPLLLYLYLPIRAVSDTPLTWGRPDTFAKVINHISAQDYKYAMFSVTKVPLADKLYTHLIGNYMREFTFIGLIFMLLGAWRLFAEKNRAGVFILGAIAVNTLVFMNYSIVDPQHIATYYFASFVTAVILVSLGIKYLLSLSERYKNYLLTGVGVFAVSFIPGNYFTVDLSGYTANREFGRNIAASVPDKAMVIVNGDVPMFSLWYDLYAEKSGKQFDIIPSFRIDVFETVKSNIEKQPVYFANFYYGSLLWQYYSLMPCGVVYKVVKKKTENEFNKVKVDALWKNYKGLEWYGRARSKNGSGSSVPFYEQEKIVMGHYVEALCVEGDFYLDHGFYGDALELYGKALTLYPGYVDALIGMARLAEKGKKPEMAKEYYDKVLVITGGTTGADTVASKKAVAGLLGSRAKAYKEAGLRDREEYYLLKSKDIYN